MAHIDEPPPGRSEVLPRLRKGDILTHCFRPFPNAPIFASGAVRPDMRLARERGVIFDIGHGMGSFDFRACRESNARGGAGDPRHQPATYMISTASTVRSSIFFGLHVEAPGARMGREPLVEVLRAATQRPAQAIARPPIPRHAGGRDRRRRDDRRHRARRVRVSRYAGRAPRRRPAFSAEGNGGRRKMVAVAGGKIWQPSGIKRPAPGSTGAGQIV